MQSRRSRNLDRKPKARHWINSNPKSSALLLKTIRSLEAGYGGSYSGFVDFAPAEYRFNEKKSGGYFFLRARSTGLVSAKVQLGLGEWKKLELKNSEDINTLVRLIKEHELFDFDFANEQDQVEFDHAVEVAA
jgi:hypothetical protein